MISSGLPTPNDGLRLQLPPLSRRAKPRRTLIGDVAGLRSGDRGAEPGAP
jgi:hypothetical protein